MSAIATLRVDGTYYTYHHFAEIIEQLDSVQGRIECDYPCLAVTLPQALGKRLIQQFSVTELQALFKSIDDELPSYEAKVRSARNRNLLIRIIIYIVGIIVGANLIKSSDFTTYVAGIMLTTMSITGLFAIGTFHFLTPVRQHMLGMQQSILAFSEVVGYAQTKQEATKEILSHTIRDWFMKFRVDRVNVSVVPTEVIQVRFVSDPNAPLLANPAPGSAGGAAV